VASIAALFSVLPAACGNPEFEVFATSMSPTFEEGDSISFDEDTAPSNGDVIIYNPRVGSPAPRCEDELVDDDGTVCLDTPTESDDEQEFLHRVVGSPGDELEMTSGALTINGEPESSDYETRTCRPDRQCSFPEIEVPEGHYFVLGDNRPSASDSRFAGFIPSEWILGVVTDDGAEPSEGYMSKAEAVAGDAPAVEQATAFLRSGVGLSEDKLLEVVGVLDDVSVEGRDAAVAAVLEEAETLEQGGYLPAGSVERLEDELG
jgi:signal peptidase I